MLALALAASLLANAPAADAPRNDLAPIMQPHPGSIVEGYFPRMPMRRFLRDTGLSMARPLMPQPTDWWLIATLFFGTAAAVAVDVPVYAWGQTLPDPVVLGQRVSWWGSELGDGGVDVAIFVLIGLLGGRTGTRVMVAGLEALAAVAVVSRIGKLIFRLERPSYDGSRHHWWSERLEDRAILGVRLPIADAMPSGHTMAAFATAAVLASEWPRLAPLFYALAAYVGLTRIQQSTHWLSDVVAGAVLGTLLGVQAWKLTREFELEVQPWAGFAATGVQVSARF